MSAIGKVSSFLRKNLVKKGKKMLRKDGAAPALPKAAFDYRKEAKSEYFTLGFAAAEIMPSDVPKTRVLPMWFRKKRLRTKKYYVAGYSAWNPADEVLDPMTTSAVYLDDNSGRGGVVMVSVDSVGLSSGDINMIREALETFRKETGIRAINILSTHNHAGIDTIGMWGAVPKSGWDKDYRKIVHAGIQKVVKEAYANRREGDLYYGRRETPPIQRDSRLPHVFNKYLTRLRFAPSDGGREVWIINYASHTESMLGASQVSADFVCYARRDIQRMAGADSIFFVGAIGGLIRLKELDKEDIATILHTDYSDIEQIAEAHIRSTYIGGRALAETAVDIEDEQKLAPVINCIVQPYYADADNHMLATILRLGMVKNKPLATGTGSTGLAIKTEMSYYEIGGLNMLLLPCELFPELAYGGYLSAEESAEGKSPDINPTPLVDIAGDKDLLVFGVANDFTGYVVPPNDFYLNEEEPYINGKKDRLGRGHYEETNSLGPATAQIIADTFAGMMETVRQTKAE